MASGVKAAELRTWARRLAGQRSDVAALDLVGQVVAAVSAAVSQPDPGSTPKTGPVSIGPVSMPASIGSVNESMAAGWPEPPGGWANPWLPGLVHEQAVSAESRGARGAWYTPESVVRGLVALAESSGDMPDFAVDPTCGGGAFLLAALDRYVSLGVTPERALTMVAGMDIDAGAVQVSRWAVQLWASANGVTGEVSPDLTRGDALAGYPAHWPPVKLIIGNPPFATPLRTGALPPEVEAFRSGREHLLGPYADLAAMHLLAAVENSAPGSVVALVQPQSVLAGRDTGPLRSHCDRVAPLHALWAAREPVFDAGVRACAAVLRPGGAAPTSVRLAGGPDVAVLEESGPAAGLAAASSSSGGEGTAWSGYGAKALGAPDLPAAMTGAIPPSDRLGSLANATAGFRDEYYGLVEACAEWTGEPGAEPNRLLTVGGVEPLAARWGIDRCRFGGQRWLRPWIDVERLEPKVRTWTERRLEPKVVVATQSKLLEPVIDRTGSIVPATPLLAVHCSQDELDLVAAVFLAPPVVAWAWRRWFGAAMAVDALKLAARQVTELPLPTDRGAWREAAGLLADNPTVGVEEGWSLSCAVAATMNRAYRADRSVLDWWLSRSKRR